MPSRSQRVSPSVDRASSRKDQFQACRSIPSRHPLGPARTAKHSTIRSPSAGRTAAVDLLTTIMLWLSEMGESLMTKVSATLVTWLSLPRRLKVFFRFTGARPPFTNAGDVDVLHIKQPQAEQQEVIQERIISPQAQREHGDAVASATARSFLSRSASRVSLTRSAPAHIRRSPDAPSPPPVPARETFTTKIRRSLAPSFTSRPSTSADSERCDSRQSERSDSTLGTMEAETDDDAESLRSNQTGGYPHVWLHSTCSYSSC